jgi:hypothetical protein
MKEINAGTLGQFPGLQFESPPFSGVLTPFEGILNSMSAKSAKRRRHRGIRKVRGVVFGSAWLHWRINWPQKHVMQGELELADFGENVFPIQSQSQIPSVLCFLRLIIF